MKKYYLIIICNNSLSIIEEKIIIEHYVPKLVLF